MARRPKTEEFGDYLLIGVKRLFFDEHESEINDFQVNLIIGNNFVISFQEKEDDIFNPIVERISKGKGKIRQMGADYLAYCLLDVIVDSYFIIMQKVTEKIEIVEDQLLQNQDQKMIHLILYSIIHLILYLNGSIWPLRDVIIKLERTESSYIKEDTKKNFKEIQNPIVQIIDNVEVFRAMLSGMLEIYSASVSNRLSEIMKVLTIISTIFMPLSFITSLYGMNFQMPEYMWEWSYFFVMLTMILITLLMTVYFRRKKWI